jgi:hypothetical protein
MAEFIHLPGKGFNTCIWNGGRGTIDTVEWLQHHLNGKWGISITGLQNHCQLIVSQRLKTHPPIRKIYILWLKIVFAIEYSIF